MRQTMICVALAASCSRPIEPARDASRALDGFEDIALWKAVASDEVTARVEPVDGVEGRALRLGFDFHGHSGYAMARRALPLDLPSNFELSFDLRGDAPVNHIEIKLVDESGDNVWWFRRSDFAFPKDWERVTIKKRQIEFAWGPTKDRELRRAATLELVVSAGRGRGRGAVFFDRLAIREIPPLSATPPRPVATASSTLADQAPALALDGRVDTAWRSAAGSGTAERFEVDLGTPREFGGVVLRWKDGAHASSYDVELSQDAATWRVVRRVVGSNGRRDALLLPESEARFLRVTMHEGTGTGYELAELEIKDLAFGATPNAFIGALAKESPRGRYPRSFAGEQPYWTIVGVDGATRNGLLSEDGALEVGKGGFSVEPFVISGSRLTTWADVAIAQSLLEGYLPIPTVTWRHPDWELRVTAFAAGEPARAQLAARYELANLKDQPLSLRLVLAVRPFQVNPPTQSMGVAGGVSPIRELEWDGAALSVNGAPAVVPLQPPDHVGLSSFDAGGFPVQPPSAGGRAAQHIQDATGLASGALVYDLHLAPGARATLGLVSPLIGSVADRKLADMASMADLEKSVASSWREKLNRVSIEVPAAGQAVVDTLRTSLAHILMSREGPGLQPGTRSYDRSWIRDGAMISESLLRLGHEAIAAEFLRWYAPYQFDSGKVPCCVDARGSDPVAENDSPGEFIFLAAEVYRFTGDRALLQEMWPRVEAAARYLETLRQSERTAANQKPERRAFYGLLPRSISHEGYSGRPAYSYWDDFWGLIGYQDATAIAEALGHREARDRLARQRDEFREDLYASLRASPKLHRIAFLPGAADLGDFDPTSTTIALAPGREDPHLPRDLLLATFERYWQEHSGRQDGTRVWEWYTPYELRVVGTFIRLGWRKRAEELLAFFFADRRPSGWNQWAEAVGRELREPRFIGDMPHAWVGSDYIRSALDMFVYAREADRTLVLAAGVPPAWFDGPGLSVRNLRTPHGQVSYDVSRAGSRVVLKVTGRAPPGGFVLPWPWEGPPGRATVNGKPVTWQGGELRFTELPARVVVERH